jgi:hypothetical protein
VRIHYETSCSLPINQLCLVTQGSEQCLTTLNGEVLSSPSYKGSTYDGAILQDDTLMEEELPVRKLVAFPNLIY